MGERLRNRPEEAASVALDWVYPQHLQF
jgi:hypothetical protein